MNEYEDYEDAEVFEQKEDLLDVSLDTIAGNVDCMFCFMVYTGDDGMPTFHSYETESDEEMDNALLMAMVEKFFNGEDV